MPPATITLPPPLRRGRGGAAVLLRGPAPPPRFSPPLGSRCGRVDPRVSFTLLMSTLFWSTSDFTLLDSCSALSLRAWRSPSFSRSFSSFSRCFFIFSSHSFLESRGVEVSSSEALSSELSVGEGEDMISSSESVAERFAFFASFFFSIRFLLFSVSCAATFASCLVVCRPFT